jgi:uncharacterized protein
MRLSNPGDRGRVKGALPDNLAGLMDLLPVLRTGETIISGEAARLPVRCRVALPPADRLPKSADPAVSRAWRTRRVAEGYERMVASWRAQRTTAIVRGLAIERLVIREDEQREHIMIREPVGSSNVASIGYDAPSETLEVEFTNGSIYQYFNIPSGLYDQLMSASSKGQFLNVYIKNAYPYSRVG